MSLPDLSLPLSDPVAVFTVVLLVLLAAPLLGRRGIPSSVVLLVAGIVLGPNALGVLDRDPTMVLLGTIGLLYIMFLAGLEIDLFEFIRHRKRSAIFGGLTFGIPQLAGMVLGRLVLGMDWPAAILLGSVFASHTLLAYPVAARFGLQKENTVTT
ncbi:MAG: cation:proton antiporter, partial [Rubricoccaceae bacterium]|nr:cation:proton antiporter [Rubricoccaceae bacterium]